MTQRQPWNVDGSALVARPIPAGQSKQFGAHGMVVVTGRSANRMTP
jgi:hypothetical protein